jgi:hypothetical protein
MRSSEVRFQGKPDSIFSFCGFPVGKRLGARLKFFETWQRAALCRGEATREFQARSPDADRIAWALLP